MNLTVMEVAKILRADLYGPGVKLFPSVSIDTRTLNEGDIFWALKGPNFDGHDFVEQALKKGASGAVVNCSQSKAYRDSYPDRIFMEVDNSETALPRLAAWWRSRIDIPVIAITGSIGKTTTKDWAADVLAKKYRVFKTPGNRNNLIGLPLALFNLAPYHQIAIVEMGANHEYEISHLCRIASPNHGLITRIAPVHLEGFGNLNDVIRAKTELYDYLRPEGVVLVPVHDPLLLELAQGLKIIGYGLGEPPVGAHLYKYFQVNLAGHSPQGQPILEIEDHKVTLKVIGDLWIPSAIAAIAIGQTFEVPIRDIVSVLERLDAGPGRLKSFNINGVEVWDDTYNSNPESLKAAIELLISRPAKRKIAVIGDMLELGKSEKKLHQDIGTFLNNHPLDALFSYGKRAAWIAETVSSKSKIKVESFTDQESLGDRLKDFFKPDDAVLFKASRGLSLEKVLVSLFPDIDKYYKEITH